MTYALRSSWKMIEKGLFFFFYNREVKVKLAISVIRPVTKDPCPETQSQEAQWHTTGGEVPQADAAWCLKGQRKQAFSCFSSFHVF